MITAFVICPDPELRRQFEAAAMGHRDELATRLVDEYPPTEVLQGAVRNLPVDAVFIAMTDPAKAEELARAIDAVSPHTQVVAIAETCSVPLLEASIRAGMRDFLTAPFSSTELKLSLSRIRKRVLEFQAEQGPPKATMIGFVSAKPGCGSTTVALHTALQIARVTKARTALLDFDARSSMLEFLLKLEGSYGLFDAARFSDGLEPSVWGRLVNNISGVDVVVPGANAECGSFAARTVENTLDYASNEYDFVCVDVPSTFDQESLQMLDRCRSVLLICTPELGPLHMTRRRIETFKHYGMAGKVHLLVNRLNPRAAIAGCLEEILKTEVYAKIPNSYDAIQRAIQKGRPLDHNTVVGKSFTELARKMTGLVEEPKKGVVAAFISSLLQSPKPLPAPDKARRALVAPMPGTALVPVRR